MKCRFYTRDPNSLFVQLLRLGQTLLLGALLGNLTVVVRLSRAWCCRVGSDLGLDRINNAAALVLALVDGLRGVSA